MPSWALGRPAKGVKLVASVSPSTRTPCPGYLPSLLLFSQGCGATKDRPLSGLAYEGIQLSP